MSEDKGLDAFATEADGVNNAVYAALREHFAANENGEAVSDLNAVAAGLGSVIGQLAAQPADEEDSIHALAIAVDAMKAAYQHALETSALARRAHGGSGEMQ